MILEIRSGRSKNEGPFRAIVHLHRSVAGQTAGFPRNDREALATIGAEYRYVDRYFTAETVVVIAASQLTVADGETRRYPEAVNTSDTVTL
jgi:hypothetical protein